MHLSRLFEFVVISTYYGGVGLGFAGLIICLSVSRDFAEINDPEHLLRLQHFRDASNLLLLTSVIQTAILLLPFFYNSPRDVPAYLAEPSIMAGATLAVVWIWAGSLFIRAGRSGWRSGITLYRRIMICTPGLVTLVLFVLYYIKMYG